MGAQWPKWLKWAALAVALVIYNVPLWLYAYLGATIGLVEPGWTDSAWRTSTRAYYFWFGLLGFVVLVALAVVWFTKPRYRCYWALMVVAPFFGMMLFRAYFWEIYPPWDRDLWIEWSNERGGYTPKYIDEGDEVYWERKRQEEAEEEARP